MANAAGFDEFVTPRTETLSLRSAANPGVEQTVLRGEPLLLTDRLEDGFVEVDFLGQRWLAQEPALTRWSGQTPTDGAATRDTPVPSRDRTPTRPPRVPQAPQRRPSPPVPALDRRVIALIAIPCALLVLALIWFTGFWKTPAGWVMCEDGAPIADVRIIDVNTAFVYCRGSVLRAPFRKYGQLVAPPLARTQTAYPWGTLAIGEGE